MSGILNENLIATLEQSLRQTRNAQTRLVARLREVETEAQSLSQEIEALENSASQTEQAIYSLLATMRSGKLANYTPPGAPPQGGGSHFQFDDDQGYRRPPRQQGSNNGGNNNNYGGSVSYFNNSRNMGGGSNVEPISQRFSDRTITQACTLILREAGNAMHVNELYNMLRAGGMQFSGNNPTISIAVSLNRNRRFRKVAPGTFDLVIRDAAQAAS